MSNGPVRKLGGGANPLAVTKIFFFLSKKEKKMQNVLKWKNMQKYFARVSVKTFNERKRMYDTL